MTIEQCKECRLAPAGALTMSELGIIATATVPTGTLHATLLLDGALCTDDLTGMTISRPSRKLWHRVRAALVRLWER